MRTLSVAQFKAQFGHLVSHRTPVLVRKRKILVGLWQPLEGKQLQAKKADILRGFVKLGESTRRDIAARHDEYLYGKPT